MATILSLLALAIGLAMDAFAAAVAQGACARERPAGTALRIGAAFGVAQGVMPLIGAGLGIAFAGAMRDVDHWVALVLLGVLGARMIREGLSGGDDAGRRLAGWALLTAALATSVDAMAAGVTLPLLGVPVLLACAVIGATTALLCYGGVFLGAAAGTRVGRRAEIAGGLVLIGLGVKIFVEHQFLGGG